MNFLYKYEAEFQLSFNVMCTVQPIRPSVTSTSKSPVHVITVPYLPT